MAGPFRGARRVWAAGLRVGRSVSGEGGPNPVWTQAKPKPRRSRNYSKAQTRGRRARAGSKDPFREKENAAPEQSLKNSFLPQINNIKRKLEQNQRESRLSKAARAESGDASLAEGLEESTLRKKNQFVEVYVRVRPFMRFEFRDKHKSGAKQSQSRSSTTTKSWSRRSRRRRSSASSAASSPAPASRKSSS